MKRGLLATLLVASGVVGAFALGASLTPVQVAPFPGDGPDFDVVCKGEWNGRRLSQQEFDSVVVKHKLFLAAAPAPLPVLGQPYGPVMSRTPDTLPGEIATALPPSVKGEPFEIKAPGRADFCGARLANLDFHGADLRYARLMGARIENSELSGVNLSWAHMERLGMMGVQATSRPVRLFAADARGMMIYDSQLPGIDLTDADLSHADINNVTFSEALFKNTKLIGAMLKNIGLKDASMSDVKFAHTLIDIRAGQLPLLPTLRDAEGLSSLHAYRGAKSTLRQMRAGLKDAGLAIQAADLNFAIERLPDADYPKDDVDERFLEKSARWVFLGIPYAYGAKPERPFLIGLLMIPIFGLFYVYSIAATPDGSSSGIWMIFRPINENDRGEYPPVILVKSNCNAIMLGIWFSILSAFRIGWKDFNIGEWISRLQTAEYEFKATGVERTVAGTQSLLSVYLLGLSVAAYLTG